MAGAGDQERRQPRRANEAENLYHSGIVVDDLDATLDWFTKVAGYRWTDVVEVDQVAQTPGGEVTIPMRMVYSGDAPRVEILQTAPGTIWVPADSGVHHLGYWSDDVESDLATLESNGMRYEAKSYNPDGSGHAAVGLLQGPDRTAHRTGQPGDGTVHRILVVDGRRMRQPELFQRPPATEIDLRTV